MELPDRKGKIKMNKYIKKNVFKKNRRIKTKRSLKCAEKFLWEDIIMKNITQASDNIKKNNFINKYRMTYQCFCITV